jgi:hypothetical protein
MKQLKGNGWPWWLDAETWELAKIANSLKEMASKFKPTTFFEMNI